MGASYGDGAGIGAEICRAAGQAWYCRESPWGSLRTHVCDGGSVGGPSGAATGPLEDAKTGRGAVLGVGVRFLWGAAGAGVVGKVGAAVLSDSGPFAGGSRGAILPHVWPRSPFPPITPCDVSDVQLTYDDRHWE